MTDKNELVLGNHVYRADSGLVIILQVDTVSGVEQI